MPPLQREHLFDNFVRTEVALPTLQSAGAKFAAVSAADLRRNAKGAPVAGIAVKRGSGGEQPPSHRARGTPPPPKIFFFFTPRLSVPPPLKRRIVQLSVVFLHKNLRD